MPTNAENLASIKANVLATLAEITANPKPTYSIDGKVVSWTEYQEMWMRRLETVNNLINAETIYEFNTQGFS